MINTIYLVSFLHPSGPINQSFNLVTGFNKKDVNAIVVTLFPEKEDSWLGRFRDAGIEVIQLDCGKLAFMSARRKLLQVIKERNITVVHAAGVRAVITASLLPKHITTVMTARSHLADLEEGRNSWLNVLSQKIFVRSLKRFTVLAACSKSLASDLKKETGLDFVPVQNAADTDKFRVADVKEKNALREKLNIKTEGILFVTLCVLYPRKNIELLIRSFNLLGRDDYSFVIVGDGEEKERLQLLAEGNKNIQFVGKHENVVDYYQAADVFVSSSLAEGLPNTVIEAMACGLPCVLSDIGPHEEILEYDSEAGIIASLDKKDWTEELNDVFAWNLQEKSEKARQIIDNHLSKYIMAERYARLYQSKTT